MTLPYRPERADEAGWRFGAAAARIRAGESAVAPSPEATVLRECDPRALCGAEGVISIIGEIGGISESEALAA